MFKSIVIVCSLLHISCVGGQPQKIVMTDINTFDVANKNSMDLLQKRAVKIEWSCDLLPMGLVGSGVVIGHQAGKTLVATADHVSAFVDGAGCDLIVKDWEGKSGFAKILSADKDSDVSVLEVGEPLGKVAEMHKKPYLGQPITCVGWPMLPHKVYEGQSITRGHVSTLDVGGFIRVSADLYFGNSGGACFSNNGKVVGIVSHFMIGGRSNGVTVPQDGQYYISHIDNIKKLLEE